jgi:hypothetical protein
MVKHGDRLNIDKEALIPITKHDEKKVRSSAYIEDMPEVSILCRHTRCCREGICQYFGGLSFSIILLCCLLASELLTCCVQEGTYAHATLASKSRDRDLV